MKRIFSTIGVEIRNKILNIVFYKNCLKSDDANTSQYIVQRFYCCTKTFFVLIRKLKRLIRPLSSPKLLAYYQHWAVSVMENILRYRSQNGSANLSHSSSSYHYQTHAFLFRYTYNVLS